MALQVTMSWTNADGSSGIHTVVDNVEAYAPGSPIFALSGDDTLTGAAGNDTFIWNNGDGNDDVDEARGVLNGHGCRIRCSPCSAAP